MTCTPDAGPQKLLPFEFSRSYQKLLPKMRRAALDEAFARAEQTEALSQRRASAENVLARFREQSQGLETARDEAKTALAKAAEQVENEFRNSLTERTLQAARAREAEGGASEARLNRLQRLEDAETRVTALGENRPSTEDIAKLEAAVQSARARHDAETARFQTRLVRAEAKLEALKAEAEAASRKLEQAEAQAVSLDGSPADAQAEVEAIVRERRAAHARETGALEVQLTALRRKRDEAARHAERLGRTAAAKRSVALEYQAFASLPWLRRVSSMRWWALQDADHEAAAEIAERAQQDAELAVAACDASLQELADRQGRHVAQLPSMLAQVREGAHATALLRQKDRQEKTVAEIRAERERALTVERSARAEIEQLRDAISVAEADWSRRQPEIVAEATAALLQEAREAAAAARRASSEAEESLRAAEARCAAADALVTEIERRQADEQQRREADARKQLDEVEAQLREVGESREAAEKSLAALKQEENVLAHEHWRFSDGRQLGLTSFPIRRPEVQKLKEEVENALRPVPQSGPANARPPLYNVALRGDEANLYIHLDLNADKLLENLKGLRRQHGPPFFPDYPENTLLEGLRDALIPEGEVQTFLVSNTTVLGTPYLTMRPALVGPRLEKLLPAGITLVLRGGLTDNIRGRENNPLFAPSAVAVMADCPARDFEREIEARTFSADTESYSNIFPANRRVGNVLDTEFVGELPLISKITQKRLADWKGYLGWMKNLAVSQMSGLRFVDVTLSEGPDARWQFTVVAESKRAFDAWMKRFRRSEDLCAYPLAVSTKPWSFQYDIEQRNNRRNGLVVLGLMNSDPVGQVSYLLPSGEAGPGWEQPFAAHLSVALSRDDQNRFDACLDSDARQAWAAARERAMPEEGFLAVSAVGDLSNLDRQRRQLERLERGEGFAPFLPSYIFDFRAANRPAKWADIEAFRGDLDEHQKRAVQMMVSVPDVGLVQGPPGTGKTTVICEATWQLRQAGKRVLIASQANLAVDNVLERLPRDPSIRAIRIMKSSKDEDREAVESPYSRDRALATYYGSVAQACRDWMLDIWRHADAEQAELAGFLANGDILLSDLDAARADLEGGTKEIDRLEVERLELSARWEQASMLDGFARFVRTGEPHSGILPEELSDSVYDDVVRPMERLLLVGIKLTDWQTKRQGTAAQRSAWAREAIAEWKSLRDRSQRLQVDLERLESCEGLSLYPPEVTRRLAELQQERDAIEGKIATDPEAVGRYRAAQQEMRKLRQSASLIDSALYRELFNYRPETLPYFDPAATRPQIIEALKAALEGIDDVAAEVDPALSDLVDLATRSQAAAGLTAEQYERANKRLEGQLRAKRSRVEDAREKQQKLEEKMVEIFATLPTQFRPQEGRGSAHYAALRALVQGRLETIEAQLARTRDFRSAWQPLVESWAADLSDEQTRAYDADAILDDIFIPACNVVGVTCTVNPKLLEQGRQTTFDVAIIDEVSKATPTELMMVVMLARTAIFVGDHRQLPPLFKESGASFAEVIAEIEGESEPDPERSAVELTRENYEKYERMVTASFFKENFENAPPEIKCSLWTQYRMHPQIMQCVNRFYENKLICGLPDPDGLHPASDPRRQRVHGLTLRGPNDQPYLQPRQHAIWIDSSTAPDGAPHFEYEVGAGGRRNDLEAALLARVLWDIDQACLDAGYGVGGKFKQVGLISFYGHQVRRIREAVERMEQLGGRRLSAVKSDRNTVDRYQGQERPIVIVSMVRNPGTGRLSAKAITGKFERINVAFSRAQELLIIIGAAPLFERYTAPLPNLDRPGRTDRRVYREIIDDIRRQGSVYQSSRVLDSSLFKQLQ